jgi:hypothetical protein
MMMNKKIKLQHSVNYDFVVTVTNINDFSVCYEYLSKYCHVIDFSRQIDNIQELRNRSYKYNELFACEIKVNVCSLFDSDKLYNDFKNVIIPAIENN